VLFYRTVRLAFRGLAVPLFRFEVEGAHHVPGRGPAVLVAPHRSWLDPACVGAACPRPVHFLIMERVWRLSWANWFFRMMRGVPVASEGTPALPAVRAALRLLRAGELVGVFPEGRVQPEGPVAAARAGAALLAVRGPAPVVPLVVRGSARAWPRGRRWPRPAPVTVRFGPPLAPEGGAREIGELTRRIERALNELGGPARER